MKTDQVCAECAEEVVFTEDVVLLQIVQPHIFGSNTLLHEVKDGDGDFAYEPYFLHFQCWESVVEQLETEIENMPPVEDPDSCIRCRYCKSGIRQWELCGSLSVGELHVAKRAPNGVRGEDFVVAGEPDVICLYCLLLINEGVLTFWEHISQNYECGDCLLARCWRLLGDECPCPCHSELPENFYEQDD